MIQKSAVWLLDLIFGALMIVGIFIFFATIVDLILSPLVFIWTGELESVVSIAISNCFYFAEETLKLTQSLVSVTSATGLKGLDLMTNNFWEWQQSFYGRLKILSIGSLGAAYFWLFRDAQLQDSDLLQSTVWLVFLYLMWPIALAYLVLPFMLVSNGVVLLFGVFGVNI